jgi:3-isopropylmalate dehydrogenase
VHGSAPDIAGKDAANPLAMVLSAALMCRHGLGIPAVAQRLEGAVSAVLARGLRTGDLAGPGTKTLGTTAMGRALVEALAAPVTA